MLKYALSFVLLPLVACCTPVEAPNAPETAAESANFAPQSFEDGEMARTRALRSGTNSYGDTCGPLRTKLEAAPFPPTLQTRLDDGDALKLGPSRQLTLAKMAKLDPYEIVPDTAARSVVCRIVTDLNAVGSPILPLAQCSDPAYENYATILVASSSYVPYHNANNDAEPISGALTYWERCTSD